MRGRYLYSHLPFEQAIALARQAHGQTVDEMEFRAWWHASQQRKVGREPVWQAPVERDLPAGCEAYITEVTAIPQAAAIGQRPWAIRVVDLRRVVGFQILITEERIALPDDLQSDDPCALVRFALRKPSKRPIAIAEGPGANEYTVSASDANLRVMGNVRGDAPLGPFLGFVLGGGLPWIQVVAIQGRHVLRDGYHRAVGLLRAGINEVPVVRIEGVEIADLAIRPGFFQPDLVLGPQPPLVADFLDDGLSRSGTARSQVKIIRIRADEFVVPLFDESTETLPT